MLLFFALVSPSCGGGAKKSDADDWVADICAPAITLSEARGDALLDFFAVDSSDGPAMTEGFNRYSSRYGKGLSDFEKAVDASGQPDVLDGAKVRKALLAWVEAEQKANDRAHDEVAALKKDSEFLASDVDDIFFDIDFADFRKILADSGARSSADIIALIEKDPQCAFALFAED